MIETMVRTADGIRADDLDFLRFPGGEWHLRTGAAFDPSAARFAVIRGGSADDLLALGLWADLVRGHGAPARVLMPYIPAARGDRDRPCAAAVYANVITAFADELVYADIHSPRALAALRGPRATAIPLGQLAAAILPRDYDLVIAPDAGARDRAETVAAALGEIPVAHGRKHRDPGSGRLSGFELSAPVAGRRVLVVDDICDGGGTFAGIAAAGEFHTAERVDLWVTHGVFSGGLRLLANLAPYAHIYSTDSHPGARASALPPNRLHLIDLVDHVLTRGIL
ncbi:phosphoribosyltransferase family protein [Nocardia bovistercoris]|uniref:Ribose-phosphate pyrophosphokinase n=1 Tax=Nocardia bovistercoris TaxID=2785916 RepID=A0A931I9P0_9NOCA|nr:phosphoribosyltransferase family protein [Nocardia bovistercoris]MBH0777434.1 ribose-phosphate pyrophosphokinase [Nocardia bovistercoris]